MVVLLISKVDYERKMYMDSLDVFAKLMAEGFKEDPGVITQFEGIERGSELFELHCKYEIDAFDRLGCVTTYGNGKGLTIGYFTKDLSIDKLYHSLQDSAHYLMENASTDELVALQENVVKVAEIVKPDWYMKYLENENVYVLQVIVLHESLRGTGVFRKLIAPILSSAEKQNVPVVLQTHSREHVTKYEHFGFKLIEEVVSDKLNFSCYNMMKQ